MHAEASNEGNRLEDREPTLHQKSQRPAVQKHPSLAPEFLRSASELGLSAAGLGRLFLHSLRHRCHGTLHSHLATFALVRIWDCRCRPSVFATLELA